MSSTTVRSQLMVDRVSNLFKIRTATQEHVDKLKAVARIYSQITIQLFISHYKRFTLGHEHSMLFTPKQMTEIRDRLYKHMIYWESSNHRSIIDAIALALCREPWRLANEPTQFAFCKVAVCYFANFGEIPTSEYIIQRLLTNFKLVMGYRDSVGNDLMRFAAS